MDKFKHSIFERKSMKRFLFALCFLTATVGAAASAHAYSAGIAATVNDDVVTMTDVHNRVQLYLLGAPGKPPAEVIKRMEKQVLDKLIDEKLELQEASSLGIVIDQGQLDAALATVAQQNKTDAVTFKKNMMNAGVKISTLYDQIKAELAWAQVVRRKIAPQVNISESEIASELDQMTRNQTKTQYQVAEIFLNVPSDAEDSIVLQKITDAAQQISGKSVPFSMVARQISQAPGAATGGDLGWVEQGLLDPKLDEALLKLHPGELSPPVRTQKGYHLLLLRDMRAPSAAPVAAVAPPVDAATPAAAPAPAAPSASIVNVKQIQIPIDVNDPKAVVDAKTMRAQTLKNEIKSCADMDKKMSDFVSPGTKDLGTGPSSALPDALRNAAEALPVGTLSDPIRTNEGVAVIVVCAREKGANTPPAAASAAPAPAAKAAPLPPLSPTDPAARTQVVNKLGNQRIERMQQHYLSDLRATAFIDKRI